MKLRAATNGMAAFAILLLAAGLSACNGKSVQAMQQPSAMRQTQVNATPKELPIAPETSVQGDIPDSQVFVVYASQEGGYALEVPEGWARTTNGMDVTFVSKLDGLSVHLSRSGGQPSADSVRTTFAGQMEKTGKAVVIGTIENVKLQNGPAVRMAYESNSEPDQVTGKQVRLENESSFYYKNGTLAELRLWAPAGADNVDQWQRISNSFKWK